MEYAQHDRRDHPMNEHMGKSGFSIRQHIGQSDPRDNRFRRERMDGFLNEYGTPDDFSQEQHNDVSPPRDTYERYSGHDGRSGHPYQYRATEFARPRAHPNDRANRPDRKEALTWTGDGENSGISMRVARQYHMDGIDGVVEEETPCVVKVSRKSLHEEPLNCNIYDLQHGRVKM